MYTWNQILEMLKAYQLGTVLRIEIRQIEHPRDAGMKLTRGVADGPHADFRQVVDPSTVMRVRDMDGCYHAELVAIVAKQSEETEALTAGGKVLAATALGALFGAALGGKNGAFAGAAIGGLAGLAAVGVDSAEESPQTAAMAKELFGKLTRAMANPSPRAQMAVATSGGVRKQRNRVPRATPSRSSSV